MRPLALLLLWLPVLADTTDEEAAIALVQKTFDGMSAHDAAMIRSTMLPDARLYAVRPDGTPGPSRSGEDFANQIAAAKGEFIERFTAKPQVLIRGRMALVWGEYEFLRDGKFSHCGVDSASLLKTAEGWKIASLTYTMETSGCKGH
jgi:hypothetical protein